MIGDDNSPHGSGLQGLHGALLHEMPPEDFEVEYDEYSDFSLKNILTMFALGLVVIFFMFVVLP